VKLNGFWTIVLRRDKSLLKNTVLEPYVLMVFVLKAQGLFCHMQQSMSGANDPKFREMFPNAYLLNSGCKKRGK